MTCAKKNNNGKWLKRPKDLKTRYPEEITERPTESVRPVEGVDIRRDEGGRPSHISTEDELHHPD